MADQSDATRGEKIRADVVERLKARRVKEQKEQVERQGIKTLPLPTKTPKPGQRKPARKKSPTRISGPSRLN